MCFPPLVFSECHLDSERTVKLIIVSFPKCLVYFIYSYFPFSHTMGLRPAHLMFTLYSGFAIPGRFKSEFYGILKQPPSRTGVLIALETLPSILALPYFGHLADRLKSPAAVTHVCIVMSTILFGTMFPAGMLPLSSMTSFFLLCIVVSLFSVFYQPLFALGYSMAIDFLRVEDNGTDDSKSITKFGVERLWGCVGYAIITIILGIFLDSTFDPMIAYLFIFVCVMAVYSRSVIVFQKNLTLPGYQTIPATKQKSMEPASTAPTPQFWTTLRRIICDGGVVNTLCLLLFLWISTGMALVDNYLFLYLTSQLNASHMLCGMTLLVSTASEIPVYLYMPNILRMIKPETALAISGLSYAARVIGYILVPQNATWAILFLEILHGPMYATVDTASVAYFEQRADKHDQSMAQSVLATIRSVGFTTAAVSGGIIIEMFGHHTLYIGSACLALSTSLIFLIADAIHSRHTVP